MPDRPRTPSDQVARPRDTATRWVFDKTQAPWAVEASSWGSVALSTDELDRGPGLPERWVAKHYSTRHRREVGLDVISTRVCTFSRIPIVFYTKPGAESGGRQVLPLCFFSGVGRRTSLRAATDRIGILLFDNSKWWITRLGGR